MRVSGRVVLFASTVMATLNVVPGQAREWGAQTQAGRMVDAHFYCSGTRTATCTETGLPQISLTSQPMHGSVTLGSKISSNVFLRSGEQRVGKVCPKIPHHCIEIDYTPAPGFKGSDEFSYTVSNPDGQVWRDHLRIGVH